MRDVVDFSSINLTGVTKTHPAYYSEPQSGLSNHQLDYKIADAPINGLLEKSLATAIYYAEKLNIQDEFVLFFDFSGGKLDINIVAIQNRKINQLTLDSFGEISGNSLNGKITELILDGNLTRCFFLSHL